MIIKRLIVILVIVCLMPIANANLIYANANSGQSHSFGKNLSSTSITGNNTTSYQYFNIEKYWDLKKVDLKLKYIVSDLTNESLSSVTLLINETPFYSFRPEMSGVENDITIEIPVNLIVNGSNSLSFKVNNKTTDNQGYVNVCTTEDYSEKWFKISDASYLLFDYTKKPMSNQINEFYSRFLGIDMIKSESSAVLISKNASATELETAVYTISGMSRANSTADTTIPLLIYGTTDTSKKNALVYVSSYSKLSDEYKKQIDNKYDLKNNALIKLVNYNKQPVLIVTSDNNDLLIKAGKFISNTELMQQVNSNEKLIHESTNIDTPSWTMDQFVSLTENGEKITGTRHQERNYFISQPGNRVLSDSSKIRLDFSYSKNLNFDQSLATISINDKPIGSKKLTEALANGDSIELNIPKNANFSGNFTVNVEFDLEMKNNECLIPSNETPWAYIQNTSLLQLNTIDNLDLLFNGYPTPFLSDGTFNQIAVVLPYELDSYTYKTITNIFNLIGKYSKTNQGVINFYNDTIDFNVLKERNIIAIGSYQNNKLIRDYNDKLYFKYNDSGTGFISNEKMSIESEYGKTIGTLQLIESPFTANYGMLVITGGNSKQYEAASQLLSSDQSLWKVYGDAVVHDPDGNVKSYRFKQEDGPAAFVLENVFERNDVINYTLAILLTLILTILSLILLARKYWGKRGDK